MLWTYAYLETATAMYQHRGYRIQDWNDEWGPDVFLEPHPVYMTLDLKQKAED